MTTPPTISHPVSPAVRNACLIEFDRAMNTIVHGYQRNSTNSPPFSCSQCSPPTRVPYEWHGLGIPIKSTNPRHDDKMFLLAVYSVSVGFAQSMVNNGNTLCLTPVFSIEENTATRVIIFSTMLAVPSNQPVQVSPTQGISV